jgi:hypothetical protein
VSVSPHQEDEVSRTRSLLTALLTLSAVLLMAGSASARSHDRNHDRIPDRWEKRHHLSLHVKQTRRDQDHDGLTNLGEFKAGMSPRDADSDDDGLDDGDEHAGQVATFDGTTLTLSLAGGGTLSGEVVSGVTEIECDDHPAAAPAARTSSDDEGDDHGGDRGDAGDDHGGDRGQDGDDEGDGGQDDGSRDDQQAGNCGTEALQPGARVAEAELKVVGGKAVFEKLELE